MLSNNLFRALPPSSGRDWTQEDDEDLILEPAWAHLQVVYEFLLRFIVSGETEAKVAKKYLDVQFMTNIVNLFESEDPRERDYLKTILHRIYGKFMSHRPHIRRAINNTFFRFIYETERHNGITELLEILGSIINGFALPLKDEHVKFLKNALLPMHKPKCVALYHQPLSYCITQFVEKDPTLSTPVLETLLRFWPQTNSQKEVLFLGELEEILELTQAEEFNDLLVPLFNVIKRSIMSNHFQVSERALFLWNNEYIVSLIGHSREQVLPVVIEALECNLNHWNAAVADLSSNVRKLFMEMDMPLWEKCKKECDNARREGEKKRIHVEGQWTKLDNLVATKHPGRVVNGG